MNKVRQSNIELLRIFCMLGVITGHALQSLYDLHTSNFSVDNTLQILLMNACVVGVNCFILISGYFRIKQSWKGFLNLYLQLLFYACISALVCRWLCPEQPILLSLKRIFFPLTESGLWFIAAYVGLYLLSPLLNAAIEKQDNRQHTLTLALLLIVDVYIGYMHQIEEVTINGYHLIHFIVIYYLGAWLSERKSFIVSKKRWVFVWLFIIVLNTGFHAIKMVFPPVAIIYSMRYNSPMNMIASVSFFCWAMTWKCQSGFINKVAISVLAVYICGEFMPIYYTPLHYIQNHYPGWTEFVLVPLFILVFYSGCVLFDRLRILVTTPILSVLSKKMEDLSQRVLK